MRMRFFWLFAVLAVLAGLCGASQAVTLRYCSAGSPTGFDPSQSDSGIDFEATTPIFNGLLDEDRGTALPIPGLAESWSVSADGRVYTFRLRRGVHFQTTPWFKPTRDFNADDVVFTLERMRDPQQPFQRAYPTIAPYMTYMSWDHNLLKVQRVDDMTVRLELAEPDASLLSTLAFSFAGIHSAEYAMKLLKDGHPEQIKQLPVGTGPFIFKSYQKDSVLRYTRNPDYFRRDVPLVDNLVFSITPDATVRSQRLRKNECDISAIASHSDAIELAKDPGINLVKVNGLNIGYLVFNTKKPPLDRLEVRQALDLAIDKQAVVNTVFAGSGRVANSFLSSESWAHDPTLPPSRYDPAQARALLKKAGVQDLHISLWAMSVQRPYNPNASQMAQMIQADWAKIGVTARIVSYEWGEYLKRIDAGEHDVAMTGWNAGIEPSGSAGLFNCGANGGSFWCSKSYDELTRKARATSDPAQRKQLYAQAQRLVAEQLPISVIASGQMVVPTRRNVVNYLLDPAGNMRFDGVGLK